MTRLFISIQDARQYGLAQLYTAGKGAGGWAMRRPLLSGGQRHSAIARPSWWTATYRSWANPLHDGLMANIARAISSQIDHLVILCSEVRVVRVILKPGMLVVVAETDAEREAWAAWRQSVDGHAFHFTGSSDGGGPFRDIGPLEVACREPINIVFKHVEERWRPISNLAHTPFTLDGRNFESVEGFWQGLKFESETERARVAKLSGMSAKQVAGPRSATGTFYYEGRVYSFGGPGHHRLMFRACWAKFSQHGEARAALLATGNRILCHRTSRDSETIPGALMADIWMRIRGRLLRKNDDDMNAAG